MEAAQQAVNITLITLLQLHTQTFAVPWQEPWAGHIDSGSWESIRPAGVQVEGPVTHQPCSEEQSFEICALGSLWVRLCSFYCMHLIQT